MKYSPVVSILFIENAAVSIVLNRSNAAVERMPTPSFSINRAARLNISASLNAKLIGVKAISVVNAPRIASCSVPRKYKKPPTTADRIMFAIKKNLNLGITRNRNSGVKIANLDGRRLANDDLAAFDGREARKNFIGNVFGDSRDVRKTSCPSTSFDHSSYHLKILLRPPRGSSAQSV